MLFLGLGARQQKEGFSFNKVSQGYKCSCGRFKFLINLLDEISIIGLTDRIKRDVKEVDFARFCGLKKKSQRAIKTLAFEMDKGKICGRVGFLVRCD
jgi:hypothetical protein